MIYYKRFTIYHIKDRYTVFDPCDWSFKDFTTWTDAKAYMKRRRRNVFDE